jgi:uncharacterized membrane protein YagU involved in acid resistance
MALQKKRSLLLTILWAGFVVGYLDITAAIFDFMWRNQQSSPVVIFKYISSAAFGKEKAFSDPSMVMFGILFHFLIAYCFTILFMLIYPSLPFLSKNRLLTGVLYGIFVWSLMNLVIVPLSSIGRFPEWNIRAVVQALILIGAIGVPLSYIAWWHYRNSKAA